MGQWGSGLYASDFAEDLQATIKAVVRLPFEADRLVEILSDGEPAVAHDHNDPDHSVFWLVLADQLHSRGIDAPAVFDRAVATIDQDLKVAADLGMPAADLKQRRQQLARLRARISSPVPDKKRTTLQKPQGYVMETGDLFTYPVSESGECINPYLAGDPTGDEWQRPKWGAMLVVQCDRAFDFLAWYRPLKLVEPLPGTERPTLAAVSGKRKWQLDNPGTCSKSHFQRLRLEKIASLKMHGNQWTASFPDSTAGNQYAINDISIGNSLNTRPNPNLPHIVGVETIATSS